MSNNIPSLTDGFLAAHICTDWHAARRRQHTHIRYYQFAAAGLLLHRQSLRFAQKFLISAHPQATDEDSPPNNVLTYTITSTSAFPSFFSIIMVEGYAGELSLRSETKPYWCGQGCLDLPHLSCRIVTSLSPPSLHQWSVWPGLWTMSRSPMGWSTWQWWLKMVGTQPSTALSLSEWRWL